ncbi:TPA: hypothetical protein TZW92_001837 [Streptococcus suis]|nr:hypothetical protein [Streptococcus suis]HEM4766523.1 hypothetical protein [Streptococcus suis]
MRKYRINKGSVSPKKKGIHPIAFIKDKVNEAWEIYDQAVAREVAYFSSKEGSEEREQLQKERNKAFMQSVMNALLWGVVLILLLFLLRLIS